MLTDFSIVAYTTAREELLTAIGTLDVVALVLDLDEPEAANTIIMALEVQPSLGIVGVTGNSDVKHVIAAQRAGCAQFVMRPLDGGDLAMALRQSVNRIGELSHGSQTIATLGATGGAGSTTIACHLAVELAQISESPTALFDLDFEFGGVASSFDVSARYTIADLASAGAVDSSLLERTAVKLPSGVHLFARPRTVQEAHGIDERAISPILQMAGRSYRYILLDVSRYLNAVTGAAIEHCDTLLVVVQLTVPSLENARRIIDTLAAEGIPAERVQVVVNRYRKNVHSCTVAMVEKRLHQKVLTVVPNDYQAVRDALDTGTPLAERNVVRSAIRELAIRLTGDEQAAKRPNWLAKFGLGR